jgi:hypothetical protein
VSSTTLGHQPTHTHPHPLPSTLANYSSPPSTSQQQAQAHAAIRTHVDIQPTADTRECRSADARQNGIGLSKPKQKNPNTDWVANRTFLAHKQHPGPRHEQPDTSSTVHTHVDREKTANTEERRKVDASHGSIVQNPNKRRQSPCQGLRWGVNPPPHPPPTTIETRKLLQPSKHQPATSTSPRRNSHSRGYTAERQYS